MNNILFRSKCLIVSYIKYKGEIILANYGHECVINMLLTNIYSIYESSVFTMCDNIFVVHILSTLDKYAYSVMHDSVRTFVYEDDFA